MALISYHKCQGTPNDELSAHNGVWDGAGPNYSEGGAIFDGTVGKRIKFTGTETPYDDLTRVKPWSISAIIKWSVAGNYAITTTQSVVTFSQRGIGLVTQNNTVRIQAQAAADNWGVGESGSNTFNDGKFHHITGTYDGSENQNGFKIYIDGVLNRTGTFDVMDASFSGTLPAIGSAATPTPGTSINTFQGIIKEVKWYDTERTPGEIALDYVQSGLLGSVRGGKWDLDGSFQDSSGGNNNGTEDGPGGIFTLDRACGIKAYEGNGSVHINIANESNFDQEFTDDFSISFWTKPEIGGSTLDNIISKGGGINDEEGYYVGYDHTTSEIVWRLNNVAATNYELRAPLTSDEWHYVVVTYDGSENQDGLRINIDGVDQGTPASVATTGSMLNNESLALLGEADGSKEYHGILDCIEYWDIALTEDIASALFESFSVFSDYSGEYDGG